MKLFFCLLFSIVFLSDNNAIVQLTSGNISQIIRSAPKPTLIHYWVPNCQRNEEIINNLEGIYQKYSDDFQMVFIALTYSDSLLLNKYSAQSATFPLYRLNPIHFTDLNNGVADFNKILTELTKKMVNDNFSVIISSDFKLIALGTKPTLTHRFVKSAIRHSNRK